MRVLGTKLLIHPDPPAKGSIVIQKSTKGTVIAVGDEIKNVSPDDRVIFNPDRAGKFTLPVQGYDKPVEILLIDKEDVAIVFSAEEAQ